MPVSKNGICPHRSTKEGPVILNLIITQFYFESKLCVFGKQLPILPYMKCSRHINTVLHNDDAGRILSEVDGFCCGKWPSASRGGALPTKTDPVVAPQYLYICAMCILYLCILYLCILCLCILYSCICVFGFSRLPLLEYYRLCTTEAVKTDLVVGPQWGLLSISVFVYVCIYVFVYLSFPGVEVHRQLKVIRSLLLRSKLDASSKMSDGHNWSSFLSPPIQTQPFNLSPVARIGWCSILQLSSFDCKSSICSSTQSMLA